MPAEPHTQPVPAATYGTGRGGIAPAVYWPALTVIVLVSGLAIAFPERAESVVAAVQ
jgi:hypothetical protein